MKFVVVLITLNIIFLGWFLMQFRNQYLVDKQNSFDEFRSSCSRIEGNFDVDISNYLNKDYSTNQTVTIKCTLPEYHQK